MSVYVNLICRACKRSMTRGYVPEYRGIGRPILECPHCKAPNSHSDRCTEWALMDTTRKTGFIIWLVLSSAFWSAGFSFLAFVGLLAMEDRSPGGGGGLGHAGLVALVLVVSVATFGYRFSKLSNMINESNARMSDPVYVLTLKRLGLV
jgi:hypothetical protein